MKLSDDPKAYYREYAKKYYQLVRKHHAEYMDANKRRHNTARACPPPQMSFSGAKYERLTVVSVGWLRHEWYYTDREDRAQEDVLRLLEERCARRT